MYREFVSFLLFFFFSNFYFSQSIRDSSLAFSNVGISFAYQSPASDLAKRFGNNLNAGVDYFYKTKNNFLFGASLTYLFGKDIKENGILDSIATENGKHINLNGEFAVVSMNERGWNGYFYAGKQFKNHFTNPNSGLALKAGIGFLQHRIRIDDIGGLTPSLAAKYRKGYDRSTAGFALHQSISYNYFSNNRLVNFYITGECTEAFTKSMRSFDYDLRKKDTSKRIDILTSIRVGWVLPLYRKSANEFYYY